MSAKHRDPNADPDHFVDPDPTRPIKRPVKSPPPKKAPPPTRR